MSGPMYLVRLDKRGAHNLLKPKYYSYRSEVKDTWMLGMIQVDVRLYLL